jgi:acetoacetate decarboxylase
MRPSPTGREPVLNEADVKSRAFAMPLTSPAFPPGPYRFVDREYLIVTYRTDPDALRAIIRAPLEMVSPTVRYEFIKMPDSTGFGAYTESGPGCGSAGARGPLRRPHSDRSDARSRHGRL